MDRVLNKINYPLDSRVEVGISLHHPRIGLTTKIDLDSIPFFIKEVINYDNERNCPSFKRTRSFSRIL